MSDKGDYIGGGKASSAEGKASVSVKSNYGNGVSISLNNAATSDEWTATFVPKASGIFRPGLFAPASRWPFQEGDEAGIDVSGNGRGCNMISGKFSVEELATDPLLGTTRLSITFEQHCEGGATALRGVVNYEATGQIDATPTPDRILMLSGKIFRVAYDAAEHVAYGIDATNRRLAAINLGNGEVTYSDVTPVPNDICVDGPRGRLFVVNKGSTFISQYATGTLAHVRDIDWTGVDSDPTGTHFKIYCATDKVYVVDGASSPGLFTIEALDTDNPVVTDHTKDAAGVGGLVLDAAGTNLYYWSQVGWTAGSLATSVKRLNSNDLTLVDETNQSVASFGRDPLDAPVLLDETRGLVFAKNKVFDATNLTKVVYSLPSTYDAIRGAAENAYALDPIRGTLSTKTYLYDLKRYDILGWTVRPSADQIFFDKDGNLWSLTVSLGALEQQILSR